MRNLLISDRIKLTAVEEEDLPAIQEWFNDAEFLRKYDMIPAVPYSKKGVQELINYYENSNDKYVFAIRDIKSNNIIGITGFDEIIWGSMAADFFIGIGDKNSRGKGFGKETINLMLDFGFNELNFYRIQLEVISYNVPAIKLYETAGFVKEGTLRELVYRDSKRYDLYSYGILQKEWNKRL